MTKSLNFETSFSILHYIKVGSNAELRIISIATIYILIQFSCVNYNRQFYAIYKKVSNNLCVWNFWGMTCGNEK